MEVVVTYFKIERETSDLSQNSRKLDEVFLEYKFRMFMNRGCVENMVKFEECLLPGCGAAEERRFTQDLHGATSQKTAFFIVIAVKTSNLTLW
jgi:hypothetical protein